MQDEIGRPPHPHMFAIPKAGPPQRRTQLALDDAVALLDLRHDPTAHVTAYGIHLGLTFVLVSL